jgi:thiol-disulfide isomerase/thioredoxin
MKKLIVCALITIGLFTIVSFGQNQNQVPYLSTKFSPYSVELNFVLNEILKLSQINAEKFAKIDAGLEDFLISIVTGKQGNMPLYLIQTEVLSSNQNRLTYLDMSKGKDETLNLFRDTVKIKLKDESEMIAFEIVHHLATDEIQYIWLDGNNNRNEKVVFISLDHPLREKKNFPELTVEQLNGEKLSFNDLIGKTVIINWWATTCGPCIAEMPGFNKIKEQYKENPNIVFIAIAHNTKEQVSRFLENREFNYIQTLASAEAIKLFGNSYPKHVIINSAGKICFYSTGGSHNTTLEIERKIRELLE